MKKETDLNKLESGRGDTFHLSPPRVDNSSPIPPNNNIERVIKFLEKELLHWQEVYAKEIEKLYKATYTNEFETKQLIGKAKRKIANLNNHLKILQSEVN